MAAARDCDVLIVGAGPTGVTLGLMLARGGVRTIVIDKAAEIYPLPRAAHIDHEIVRIFQELGLADVIMSTCRPAGRYDFLTAKGEVLLRFDGMDRTGPGGWPASNMIHQPSLESALSDAAMAQPDLTIRRGHAFVSCATDDDGVVSEVATPSGPVTIRSRYLVGADGARSAVRTAAGITLDDLNFDEPWLVVDALVHDASRLPAINLQICDPARPTTCVLMGSGRHRWEFMLRPGETPEQVVQDDFIAALMAPWQVEGAISIERKAVYRFNARVATTWRKGPVMLAGDAAHLMPPFAGQGLCSGLRDSVNLAWKLVATVRGADDGLLDSYQPEREPNVRAIIGMAMMMGRTVCITDPEMAIQRDKQMIAARASGASPDGSVHYPPISHGCILYGTPGAGSYFPQSVSTCPFISRLDDVLGPGAWLISRQSSPVAHDSALQSACLDDTRVAPFREHLDAWLSEHQCEAVLVRPDRYVFGAGGADSLRKAWAAAVG